MARRRAASYTLAAALTLLFLSVAASPVSSRPPSIPSVEGQSTTSVKTGGWNVASIIAMSVGIVVTLVVILSLSNTMYHRHASLRIHRQLLEHISHITQFTPPILDQQPPDTGAGVGAGTSTSRPQAPWRTTTGVAADAYHLALLMSSTAHLSPTVHSAIQEQIQPMLTRSVATPAESKMRAPPVEDKVLGRREDIVSQSHPNGQATVEGRLAITTRLVP